MPDYRNKFLDHEHIKANNTKHEAMLMIGMKTALSQSTIQLRIAGTFIICKGGSQNNIYQSKTNTTDESHPTNLAYHINRIFIDQ